MKEQAFTILEVLIVIVLLGLIAAFAVPNYAQSIAKAHESDMRAQLSSLHAANFVYASQNGGNFWDDGAGSETSTAVINNNLNINLIPTDGTAFAYNGTAAAFSATATWGSFTLTVTQAILDNTNPACTGTCP